ncbi:MAG: helicase C-terminal domain-containing protein, partial [Parachlamydiaceae bacterium]|nr:helicase C-terminal domain-containing protein [Parachlamydiaceae bacterium]
IEKKLRLLEQHETHPQWIDEIIPKNKQLLDQLNEYTQSLRAIEGDLKSLNHEKLNEQTKAVRSDLQALTMRIEVAISTLNRFLNTMKDPSRVKWIELHQLKSLLNVHLVDADLDVSKALVDYLFSKFSTIILCSATLTTNHQFSYIRERLGITPKNITHRKITENVYESPFDYKKQALLVIPRDMPLPSDAGFNSAAFENIQKAIETCKGNVFVLFTSYQMLEQCAGTLDKWMKDHHYPLFKHGDEQRQILLNKFKTTPRAVLFGTDSFWEGVDVAGDALRCVIIVKLPFKVPNDPMIQARTEAILESGKDPFLEYSVPQAIVKFKQGFGRLIRQKLDRGCVVCLDTRLITKRYGQLFLNSLPECEHIFLNGNDLWPKVQEFYRKTYYLVKQSPFS